MAENDKSANNDGLSPVDLGGGNAEKPERPDPSATAATGAEPWTASSTPRPESADSLGVAIQALRAAKFSGGFRGYSKREVDGFHERVASALESARERVDRDSNEVREITDFARRALEGEMGRAKEEAARVVAEAEVRRREAEAERDAVVAERARLAEDTERAQAELKTELEHTREITIAAETARDDVVAERDRLAETRQALDNERQELARLRDEARSAESRSHELRRALLAETERAISGRWTELSDHMRNTSQQQASRLLELVSDFIKQLDPSLLTSFVPPPALSPESRPARLTAMPMRESAGEGSEESS